MSRISSLSSRLSLPPSLVWLTVFVPSLSYFLATRWPSFSAMLLQPQSNSNAALPSFRFLQQEVQQQFWLPPPVDPTPSFSMNATTTTAETAAAAAAASLMPSSSCQRISSHFYIRSSCLENNKNNNNNNNNKNNNNNNNNNNNKNPTQQQIAAFQFSQGLELLQDFPMDIVASVWRHDAELGRGYLLISSGNRIWRWERGNGPIPIGRSLHLDHAGCRHDHLQSSCFPIQPHDKNTRGGGGAAAAAAAAGVGGLTLDFWEVKANQNIYSGSLVVAEWGEGRIVRLEETTGARTPLALLPKCATPPLLLPKTTGPPTNSRKRKELSTPVATNGQRSIHFPQHLLMTPFGDLLFLESPFPSTATTTSSSPSWNPNAGDDVSGDSSCWGSSSTIYKLPQAMTVPALESLRESRLAHNHTWIQQRWSGVMPEPVVFWQPTTSMDNNNDKNCNQRHELGGMALTTSWTSLYISSTVTTVESRGTSSSSALLYQVSLVEEEDNDDDENDDKEEEEQDESSKNEDLNQTQSSENDDTNNNRALAAAQKSTQLVWNLTQSNPQWTRAGPLVVTKQGFVFCVVHDVTVAVLDLSSRSSSSSSSPSPPTSTTVEPEVGTNNVNHANGLLLGYFTLPDPISSLSLGGTEDSFLYITTLRSLWRLPTKRGMAHPVAVPTNLAPTHRQVRPQ
ncbi:hypothetical protein ACA910_017703 [Epithemia clementina (nom. ined.)]